MVKLYYIINEEQNTKIPYNEIALLKLIKSLQGRNKVLREYYIEIWETLNKEKFREDLLELV